MYVPEMFGARIEQTIGEFNGNNQWLTSMTLKVHLLRGKHGEKLIGIALVAKIFGGFGGIAMMPMTFSLSQAQQLASLIQSATRMQTTVEPPPGGVMATFLNRHLGWPRSRMIGVITGEKQRLTVHLLNFEHSEQLLNVHLDGQFADGDVISPIKLSVSQAQQLASLLERATRTH
jgi:hypothetical protein